jgi:hypothetical protein
VDPGLVVQYLIIGFAVLASAAYVVRTRMPRQVRQARTWIALRLLRDGRPGWMRRAGRRIAPAPIASGSACGSCNGCDPAG